MSATFSLGNETFSIGTELADSVRREQYFKNPNGKHQLTKEEERVLTSLGIDKSMEQTLRPYLRDFFDQLPSCTSDLKLRLNKSCEIPYYVIWSTEFAKHAQTVDRVDNYPQKKTQTQLKMAKTEAIISAIKPPSDKGDDYDKLFTLIPASSRSTGSTSSMDLFEKAFTLQRQAGGRTA